MARRLGIIDGNSLVHRAFHALPLMNSGEIYTNAVFGFWSMLIKAIGEYTLDGVCVAFDLPGATFRHEEYPEYKAGRSHAPPELLQQFDTLKDTLNSAGIMTLSLKGYEADDMLGAFSRMCRQSGEIAYLITGDRDALQLVDENTRVILTRKGISDTLECTPDVVKAEFGYTPLQVADYKGLTGDKSDNIPGVPGVGDKTALKLLDEYGTLENVLSGAESMKGAIKDKLIKNRELAEFSKRIATIDVNAPVEIDLGKCGLPDADKAQNALLGIGITALAERLRKLLPANTDQTLETRAIDSQDDFCATVNAMPSPIGVKISDAQIYVEDTHGAVSAQLGGGDLLSPGLDVQPLAEIVLKADKSIIGYDLKSVLHAADYAGERALSHDTMLGGFLLGQYAPQSGSLLKIAESQKKSIVESGMEVLFYGVEMPLISALYAMERVGFYVDKDALNKLKAQYGQELARIEGEIRALIGGEVNINSPKQLGVLLFEKLGLPSGKKTASGWSTDVETLESIAQLHPVVPLILSYRKYAKLMSTYIDALLRLRGSDGRIRTQFDQIASSTGRISSFKPNLQNIPVRSELGREIRRAFAAQPGWLLLDADYSQIELRVLAHMSGDAAMIHAFSEGADIHQSTAAEIFSVDINDVTKAMRSAAKAVNFGVVYGMSDFGLAKNAGVSRAEAADFIKRYFERYPGVRAFLDTQIATAGRTGYVSTLMGRRRYIPELSGDNRTARMFGERVAMNSPIQGTAADIIKLAMVRVHDELKRSKLSARLILQVHDELIIETPPNEKDAARGILISCMLDAAEMQVPLEVSVSEGVDWYACKMGES